MDRSKDLREAYDLVALHGSVRRAADATGRNRRTLNDSYLSSIMMLGLKDVRTRSLIRSNFIVEAPAVDRERSLDELKVHLRDGSDRNLEHADLAKLITIHLKTPGPIGLFIMGDPHIDSPGCDFRLLEDHLRIASDNSKFIFSGNIGDLRDNWIGRLEKLYAFTTVSAKETWKLVEWMINGSGVEWAWLVKGNHDCWAGINDPLDWICRPSGVLSADAGVRIAFKHPNGQETRLNARHDFPGSSQYNQLHPAKRQSLFGNRDHVYASGHRHVGADAGDTHGDGTCFQMVVVSGYKKDDHFAREKGFLEKPVHASALIIVDPDLSQTDRARVWCAPSVEEGADYLKFKRERWSTRRRRKK